jgi:hypothetical protein
MSKVRLVARRAQCADPQHKHQRGKPAYTQNEKGQASADQVAFHDKLPKESRFLGENEALQALSSQDSAIMDSSFNIPQVLLTGNWTG